MDSATSWLLTHGGAWGVLIVFMATVMAGGYRFFTRQLDKKDEKSDRAVSEEAARNDKWREAVSSNTATLVAMKERLDRIERLLEDRRR